MAKQNKTTKKPLHAAFNFSQFDAKHRQQILQAARRVEQLYNAAIQQLANKAAGTVGGEDPAAEFRWQDYPALEKATEELLDKLEKGLQNNLTGTMRDAWDLANAKNDAFVTQLAKTTVIPEALLATWRQPNLTALETLTRRIAKGMNLSNGSGERTGVWNLAQFKQELELTLQVCMGKGMSAAEMARKVKQYLKYPDKLFRRVRDSHGVLRLSKAAKAFHPGAGVYRSSYKNALRLTATENNIAYRTADHERWQQMDFVLGQHVHLSQNHTLNGKPFVDICDELSGSADDKDDPRGRYPKDFKFTGWHPFCRCYVTPIMVSQEEMAAWAEARRKGESYEFKEKPITEMPAEFAEKMRGMDERIAKAEERGTLPYFMRDNPERMAQVLGRPITVKAAEPVATRQLTPAQQAATIRHANRTADEVADIKRRAKERQELHQRIKDDAMETLATAKRKRVRLNGLEQAIADGNLDAMRGYADELKLRIQAHNELVQKAWNAHNERIKKFPLEKWKHTFVSDNGGYVVTEKARIPTDINSDEQRRKYQKEKDMCIVYAKAGYKMEHLSEIPGVSSSDARINGIPADLKALKNSNNIRKNAKKAIEKQGAQLVLFRFEVIDKDVLWELKKLANKGVHGKYYKLNEDIIKEF